MDFKQPKVDNYQDNHKNKKDIDFVKTRNLISFNLGNLKPESTLTLEELIAALTKLEQKKVDKKSYLKWAEDKKLIQKSKIRSRKNPLQPKTFTKIMNRYAKSVGLMKTFKAKSTKKTFKVSGCYPAKKLYRICPSVRKSS